MQVNTSNYKLCRTSAGIATVASIIVTAALTALHLEDATRWENEAFQGIFFGAIALTALSSGTTVYYTVKIAQLAKKSLPEPAADEVVEEASEPAPAPQPQPQRRPAAPANANQNHPLPERTFATPEQIMKFTQDIPLFMPRFITEMHSHSLYEGLPAIIRLLDKIYPHSKTNKRIALLKDALLKMQQPLARYIADAVNDHDDFPTIAHKWAYFINGFFLKQARETHNKIACNLKNCSPDESQKLYRDLQNAENIIKRCQSYSTDILFDGKIPAYVCNFFADPLLLKGQSFLLLPYPSEVDASCLDTPNCKLKLMLAFFVDCIKNIRSVVLPGSNKAALPRYKKDFVYQGVTGTAELKALLKAAVMGFPIKEVVARQITTPTSQLFASLSQNSLPNEVETSLQTIQEVMTAFIHDFIDQAGGVLSGNRITPLYGKKNEPEFIQETLIGYLSIFAGLYSQDNQGIPIPHQQIMHLFNEFIPKIEGKIQERLNA